MEVDNPELSTKAMGETAKEYQEPQPMEEESENIDIGELDILGLEKACKTRNFDQIPNRRVENLVEVLNRAKKKVLYRILDW